MDRLKIVWEDLVSRQRFQIGSLEKIDGEFRFTYYMPTLEQAKEKGFKGLVGFPDFNVVYSNKDMFPIFECRLPDKRRPDIKEILHKYAVEKFDAFELLKVTGGKLPTDTLEFYKED